MHPTADTTDFIFLQWCGAAGDARVSWLRYVSNIATMKQERLLQDWLRQKFSASGYYKLRKPITVQYELKTQSPGCYYDYAYVCFDCTPASELSFKSIADWPKSKGSAYVTYVEQAVFCGVFDILISRNLSPYLGCAVRLSVALWDHVGGSEEAFYRAARIAMERLIDKGDWVYVVPPEL